MADREVVEQVAEAIAEKADEYYWHLLTPEEREPYYKRAEVAIAAIDEILAARLRQKFMELHG